MSKVQSDTLYKFIDTLKSKLFSVKGEMDEEVYKMIEDKLKDAEDRTMNLSERPAMDELSAITKIISELEVKYLSDKAVKEMVENSQRKSFASQLETVERSIEDNIENVEEYMAEAYEYWNRIKDSYNTAEQAEIIERITGIAFRCSLEKLKSRNEVDMSILPKLDNVSECRGIIKLMEDKKATLDDISKASIELWISKVTSSKPGEIDKEEVKRLIQDEKFWRVLSGNKEVLLNFGNEDIGIEEKREESSSDNCFTDEEDKESEYDKQLKALAAEYGVPWKKLITREYEIAFVFRDDRGKCTVRKSRDIQKIVKLKDECVAAVFNNKIQRIKYRSFENFMNLEKVLFSTSLVFIGEKAFKKSGLREAIFPDWVEVVEREAFCDCKKLKNVVFNDRLKMIGTDAFCGTGVSKIKTPNSCKLVGRGAFGECNDLRIVQLNEGLEEIGYNTFFNSGVVEIEIPDTVEYILNSAGGSTRTSFVTEVNNNSSLNDMPYLKTIKVVDSERNVVESYNVEILDEGSTRKRRLALDMTNKIKKNRRVVSIDR